MGRLDREEEMEAGLRNTSHQMNSVFDYLVGGTIRVEYGSTPESGAALTPLSQ
jgi:hypothetical protein